MALDLDRLQQRIVGVLAEKEATVPETYPLTLNALVAGCNQKSNRDPQMSVEPYEAEGALFALMDSGWVVRVEKIGARTVRYEHRAREQLGVTDAELAILTELLIRGAQSPGELKTRAGRMHAFASPAAVEAVLADLAARPVPYVAQLPRRPREHAQRWEHRLGPHGAPVSADDEDAPAEATPAAAAAASSSPAYAAAPAPTPAPSPAAAAATAAPIDEDLALRVELLEQEVAELKSRLERLEAFTS